MKATLTLRLNRRAMAAVSLSDDGEFLYCDGQHLRSRREEAVRAATKYVGKLIETLTPHHVVIDAPAKDGSTTTAIVRAVTDLLRERHVPWRAISTADVLASYGIPAVHSRSELRALTQEWWSNIPPGVGKVRPFVVEAAAAGLYADVGTALGDNPT